MSILDNSMFRTRLDNDVFSGCDGAGKNDAERLTELLAAFELSKSLRQDNRLNASSNDKKVDSRISNVSPPPGFPQLPSTSSESMWKAFVSRSNSEVFPVDNQQAMTSSYNASSLLSSPPPMTTTSTTPSYGPAERKMLNELALLQRFMDRSATVSMGALSPELSRFLAELDTEAAAGSGAPVGRYKTELCRPFEEHGSCKYGDKCQFAHGRAELRSLSRHPKYKTDLCKTYHTTGLCPYGPRCHFIHNEEELAFNRAGLERQRLERELKERFEAFKQQQQQQKQQQQLLKQQQQQHQQMITAALLSNIEHKKLAQSAPLRSADFFLNPYSNLDNVRNASYAYDSLDSLTDKSSLSNASSSCEESLSSSPTLSMFNGVGGDEMNNSLNSLNSLNASSNASSTCASLDSGCSSAPISPPLLSLSNNSSSSSTASSVQNKLSPYVSNNFASVGGNVAPTSGKSALGKNSAAPGFGRVLSTASGLFNRESNSLDFIHSEAVQQEIVRLAFQLAKSMAASSSTMNSADQRSAYQQTYPGSGITL